MYKIATVRSLLKSALESELSITISAERPIGNPIVTTPSGYIEFSGLESEIATISNSTRQYEVAESWAIALEHTSSSGVDGLVSGAIAALDDRTLGGNVKDITFTGVEYIYNSEGEEVMVTGRISLTIHYTVTKNY